ncbi:MAG: chromosome segregation SMC family protein [Deinococcales bacterium]
MRLTSLSLQGFKSFGNRTSVEFAPGVTAIIGPNGSGKSNLIDALKWTTGGGRAREFRASDKTDLIFHGASGKRGLSLAEVEVELRGDGRAIKVYRSLDREGTTRLRLNGRNARFLDLEEALAGSGLGRSGVALIGQGEVSQVLVADPPKLLEYVAEVAGVGRMSSRREQTQARLETARGHLDRLQDVLVELDERCTRLGEEAADAERHATLTAEALRLRVTAARRRVEGLEEEIGGLQGRRAELQAAIAEGRVRLQELRTQLEAVRVERDAREEVYRSALAEAELKRGDLRVAEERAARARERRDAAAAALVTARDEATRLVGSEPPSAPEDDPAPSAQATAEREAVTFETRREELERQAGEVEARLRELDAAPALDLEALAGAEVEARQAAETLAGELEEARARLAEAHERHAGLEAERQALGRAAERQRAAFEARRGYAQGPRNALTSGIDGVIGSVGDLLRVPERYRAAVAAALGRRAEYVVVDRADTGRAVLRWVRERGGFVTVLPLDLLRDDGRRAPRALLEQTGVVGAAVDVVEVDPAYRAVAEQLLGGTVLVETMERATRRHPGGVGGDERRAAERPGGRAGRRGRVGGGRGRPGSSPGRGRKREGGARSVPGRGPHPTAATARGAASARRSPRRAGRSAPAAFAPRRPARGSAAARGRRGPGPRGAATARRRSRSGAVGTCPCYRGTRPIRPAWKMPSLPRPPRPSRWRRSGRRTPIAGSAWPSCGNGGSCSRSAGARTGRRVSASRRSVPAPPSSAPPSAVRNRCSPAWRRHCRRPRPRAPRPRPRCRAGWSRPKRPWARAGGAATSSRARWRRRPSVRRRGGRSSRAATCSSRAARPRSSSPPRSTAASPTASIRST